jgi:hypothetical protein
MTVAQRLKSKAPSRYRSRANMAHIRQSRPDSGLGFQVKVLKLFKGVPSLLRRAGVLLPEEGCLNFEKHDGSPGCTRTSQTGPPKPLDCQMCATFARQRHIDNDGRPTAQEQSPFTLPLSSEYGTHKTVKARFRPWRSGKSP